MRDSARVLYQFPISHYCEKVRWHLDFKGVPYRIRNLLPGFHRSTLKRIGTTPTVPVLLDRAEAIGDSLRISEHLEATYPDRGLLPPPGPEHDRCLQLERYFSEEVGPSVRRWLFGLLLLEGRGAMGRTFYRRYGGLGRLVGRTYASLLEREIRRLYDVDTDAVAQSRARAEAGLDALERELKGDYLAGDRLTVADLAAASIFGPLVAAPESPWAREGAEPAMSSIVASTRSRPAGQWVLERYRRDRLSGREGATREGAT